MAEGARAEEDPELDQLLSDALEDFGKTIPTPRDPVVAPTHDEINDDEDKLANEMESCLSEATQLLSQQNPELMKEFEKLFNQSGAPAGGPLFMQQPPPPLPPQSGQSGASVEATLEQTFQQLQLNRSQQPPDMGNLSSALPGAGDDDLMGVMQSMVDSLTSRDLLYPSLQAVCKKYPEWLDGHQAELASGDLARFRGQLEVMTKICAEFEGQVPSNEEDKLANQKRILDLMQQLQQYGQPPPELMETMEPHAAQGFPLGPSPDNCLIM